MMQTVQAECSLRLSVASCGQFESALLAAESCALTFYVDLSWRNTIDAEQDDCLKQRSALPLISSLAACTPLAAGIVAMQRAQQCQRLSAKLLCQGKQLIDVQGWQASTLLAAQAVPAMSGAFRTSSVTSAGPFSPSLNTPVDPSFPAKETSA